MGLNQTIAFNVKFYRKQNKLNQKEFAEKCGFSPSLLQKLETGKLNFSQEHINAAAFALDLPPSKLLQPFLFPERGYFRASKKMKDGVLLLNRAARWVRHYHFLENLLNCQRPFSPSLPEFPERSESGLCAFAGYVRQAFGLDNHEPIQNLEDILEDFGVKLLFLDWPSDGFFGFSLLDPAGIPSIVINTSPKITRERQIFSLAHELGHVLLHLSAFGPCCEVMCGQAVENGNEENEANWFAGAFLMPECGFFQEWERCAGWQFYERVLCVKQKFRVSYAAVLNRLVQLKISDASVFPKFYNEYQKKNGRSLEKNREPLPLICSFQASRFRNLVFQALEKEEISVSKAAEMLQLPIDEILNVSRGGN